MTPSEIANDIIRNMPPGSVAKVVIAEQSGTATGASAQMKADDLDSMVTGEAPTVTLEGAGASAGGLDQTASGVAWGGGDGLALILLWVGIALIVSGAGAWWAGLRKLAVHAGIVGAALIVCALYPGFAVLALLAAVIVAIGPQAIADWQARTRDRTLAKVVEGVERSGDRAALVKDELARVMDTADKRLIEQYIGRIKGGA